MATDPHGHDDPGEPVAPRAGRARRSAGWLVAIAGTVVLALILRTFVVQTFWIPTGSMEPTLTKGDRIVVNELAYRLGEPRRGDVVVFRRPASMPSAEAFLVKRVVAVGGESVSIRNGTVHVDGKALTEPYVHGLATSPQVSCPVVPPTAGIDTAAGFTVPDGSVLVMGDNRSDSTDGRCFGPVDEGDIVGRAEVIAWPPSRLSGL